MLNRALIALFIFLTVLPASAAQNCVVAYGVAGFGGLVGDCSSGNGLGAGVDLPEVGDKIDSITVNDGARQTDVMINPRKPMPAPPGWTPSTDTSTATNAQPNPPAVDDFPPGDRWRTGSGLFRATPGLACDDGAVVKSSATGQPGRWSYSGVTEDVNSTQKRCGMTDTLNGTTLSPASAGVTVNLTANTCDSGYTPSSGQCVLTTATQVDKPLDGKCTVMRSGNTFSGDTRDPDCGYSALGSTNHGQLKVNSATNISGTDTQGNTVDVTITGSSAKVTVKNGKDGATKTTVINTGTPSTETSTNPDTFAPPVTGTSQNATVGTGDQSTTTPSTSGSGTPLDISSLNKEGTQQQAVNKLTEISGKLDDIQPCGGTDQPKCQIDEGDTATTDTDMRNKMDQEKAEMEGYADELEGKIAAQQDGVGSGLTNPLIDMLAGASGSTCTNPVFDATSVKAGAISTIDICSHRDQVHDVLGWCLYALTAVGIWGVFFTKYGG